MWTSKMRKVFVVDTSILCVLLGIPGMDTCGPDDDRWDYERCKAVFDKETDDGTTFVLPIATIIETGNHISQVLHSRRVKAQELVEIVRKTLNEEEPWAAFSQQEPLWTNEGWNKIIDEWPDLANAGISIGDATIRDVAEYYAKAGFEVTIFTGDAGLKAYEPARPPLVPRRRS